MNDAIGFAIVMYLGMAFVVGMLSQLVLDDAYWCPEDGKPALAVTFGALWPLSLIVGVVYALWLAGRALGRSFAALWRAWRPVQVPRATARNRSTPGGSP